MALQQCSPAHPHYCGPQPKASTCSVAAYPCGTQQRSTVLIAPQCALQSPCLAPAVHGVIISVKEQMLALTSLATGMTLSETHNIWSPVPGSFVLVPIKNKAL